MIAVVFGTAFGGKWFEYVFSKFGVGVLGEVRWLSVGVHRHRRGGHAVWHVAIDMPHRRLEVSERRLEVSERAGEGPPGIGFGAK